MDEANSAAAHYRAGIVGAGFMGRVHAHAVRANGGQLAGVIASNADKSRAAAAELGAESDHTDFEQLIADDSVDVIHVCTPNHLHEQQVRAALKAGKHVVCEKPLATSVAAAADLVGVAAETERVTAVPFVYRFHPMAREARERVRRGDAGAITLIHGSYLQDWLASPADVNWRVDPERGGPSRAFADIGSHWCDLVEFISGKRIASLSARTATVFPEREQRSVATEDVVTMQFVTTDGVLGSAVISQISPGRKNRLLVEITGAEATLTFDQEQPEVLWRGGRDHSRLLVRDPDTMTPAAAKYARVPAGHAQGYQDCFNALVADTAAAIAGDAPDGLPTFTDGLRAARLADAVLASARDGQWVDVAP
jgi:predicted dehydrogenase